MPSFNVPKLSPSALKGDKIDLKGKKGIVLFYADWCGYCQKFKPTYQELFDETKNENIKAIHCPDAQSECASFGISSYPTVLFVHADGTTEQAPSREKETLKAWLNQSGGRRRRRSSRHLSRRSTRHSARRSSRRSRRSTRRSRRRSRRSRRCRSTRRSRRSRRSVRR